MMFGHPPPPSEEERRRNKFSEGLMPFLKHYLTKCIREESTILRELRRAQGAEREERWEQEVALIRKRKELDGFREMLAANHSFEEDFERILLMNGIQKLTIEDSYVVIYTQQISLTTEASTYDIGQFTIKIEFGKSKPDHGNDIHFIEGPYLGEFKHPHAQERNTCFGNPQAKNGLNESIDKLLAELQAVKLIHLILSFLRWDNVSPGIRDSASVIKNQGVLETTGYASEQDRLHAKQSFVVLMKELVKQKASVKIQTEIRSIQATIDAKTKNLFDMREKITHSAFRKEMLENKFEKLALRVAIESRTLADITEVHSVIWNEEDGTLLIGIKLPEDVPALFVLSDNKIPRVKGVREHFRYRAFIDEEDRFITRSPLYERLLTYQSDQMIAEVVTFIKDILVRGKESEQGGDDGI